jgi:hypothetical protein
MSRTDAGQRENGDGSGNQASQRDHATSGKIQKILGRA